MTSNYLNEIRKGSITRRRFIGGMAAALAAPGVSFAQQAPRVRLPWSRFKASAQLGPLMRGIELMRRNSDPADPNGWLFWAESHVRYCPHGRPYFLAWHRGWLALLERRLQALSNVADLTLPYWDYYAQSTMPGEFTQGSASNNPLFHGRFNTSVGEALLTTAFSPRLTAFPLGQRNAFEPAVESYPHNKVHSLIGDDMASMLSPKDPIFFVHHANIDRLWTAWAAAGGGRQMPPTDDPYWSGQFNYGAGLSVPRSETRESRAMLGYHYENETLPASQDRAAPGAPRQRDFAPGRPRPPRPNFFALGPSAAVTLGAESLSLRLPISTAARPRLAPLIRDAAPSRGDVQTVALVLDEVRVTEEGRRGGFYYEIYANLPAAPGRARQTQHLIGSVTPFELATWEHHAVHDDAAAVSGTRLVFPATEILRALSPEDLSQIMVSFVRVSGERSPAGPAIAIGDVRLEASSALQP